ncbi:hypothetical protein ACH4SK_16725 [Streptomyces inhibens]|uniref:hypothetical protein n=1 Tax=Streptomyces inhibens TaxID=2293571 RepID=UPI0037B909C3
MSETGGDEFVVFVLVEEEHLTVLAVDDDRSFVPRPDGNSGRSGSSGQLISSSPSSASGRSRRPAKLVAGSPTAVSQSRDAG